MQIQSPAKVNLFLRITGKRTDGYHTLVSLMCPIRLYDTLSLSFGENQIRVSCDAPDVPEDESNLCFKAAQLFYQASGIHDGVHISIIKHIPAGAGLGGGSSNAAAVLNALNGHYGNPFSQEALMETGLALGADVPFFINGTAAIATGIGEKLEPFRLIKPYHMVLVYPGFMVSTAAVYKNLNLRLTKYEKDFRYSRFKTQGFDVHKHLCNDLEMVTTSMHPEIASIKQLLLTQGAEGALMSGSGSSVFGLFSDIDKARNVYLTLSQHKKWQVFLTDLIV